MNPYPAFATPTGATQCVAPGCRRANSDDEPRPAVRRADLCTVHVQRFQDLLGELRADIPRLERALVRRPTMSATLANADEEGLNPSSIRSGGVRGIDDAWNPAAAAALYWIRDWTGFLVRVIRRWNVDHTPIPYQPPEQHRPMFLSRDGDVRLSLDIIRRHHYRWLAQYPTLGAGLLTEAIDLRSRAIAAVDAPTVRRIGLHDHYCQHVEQDTTLGPVVCLGQLVAILRDQEADHRPSTILCQINPEHRIQIDEWMAYAG